MFYPRLWSLLRVLMNSLSMAIAQTAYLESDSIVEGEVAVLVVKYSNNRPPLYSLDTWKLEHDFQVLSVSPSVSKQFENENLVNVMRWEVLLAPRLSGSITIPALTIKDFQTQQLSLKVNQNSAAKGASEKVFSRFQATEQTLTRGSNL